MFRRTAEVRDGPGTKLRLYDLLASPAEQMSRIVVENLAPAVLKHVIPTVAVTPRIKELPRKIHSDGSD